MDIRGELAKTRLKFAGGVTRNRFLNWLNHCENSKSGDSPLAGPIDIEQAVLNSYL